MFEKRSWRMIELGRDGLVLLCYEDKANSRSYLTYQCCRCCFQVLHNDEMMSKAYDLLGSFGSGRDFRSSQGQGRR